ncbi:Calx-beta domain-containing protein [Actinoplanes italicus]|uniref:Calx-beta domain-containing protein n=1 Tax=Actinoplanes italicus TaxID=113567 RepID=UPI000D073737|nr:Calx-beta domain-containing protein [Actinoplanes italicus]
MALVPATFIASPAYAAVIPNLTITPAANWEGGTVDFKITYTGASASRPITFSAIQGTGNATVTTDFGGTPSPATYTFPGTTAGGTNTITVSVTTTTTGGVEGNETFQLQAVQDVDGPALDAGDIDGDMNTTEPIPDSDGTADANDLVTLATGTIYDLPASPPTLNLSVPASVPESQASVPVVATLTGILQNDITIPIAAAGTTIGGTVSAASSTGGVTRDFTALASDATITIPAGQLTGSINFAVNDDTVDEVDLQYVRFTATGATGVVLGSPATADLGIEDNDAVPTVSIGDAAAVNEGVQASFPIKLSNLSERDLTVNFWTMNGTDSDKARGAGNADFTGVNTPTPVSIPALTQTAYQTVATTGSDSTIEGTETFTGMIATPSTGLTLGTPTTATATIKDTDTLPGIDFTDLDLVNNRDAGDNAGFDADVFYDEGASSSSDKQIAVTVALGAGTRETPLKIDYSFVDGTATNGSDYKGTSGTLTIPISQAPSTTWTGTIPVTIMGDTTYEGITYNTSMRAESFTIKLASSNNSILATDLAITQPVYIVEGTDDSMPTWSTSDVSLTEGNEGQSMAKVPVTLSAPLGSDVTFTADFSTPGSATETGVNAGTTVGDNDYDYPASKNVTIKAGQTTAYLEVPINGDAVYERDEALVVTFTPTSAAVSNTVTADVQHASRVTITGDDAKPTLKITEIAGTEGTTIRAIGTLVGVSQYNYTLGVTAAGAGDNPATRAVDFEVPSTLATLSIPVTRGKTALTDAESRLAEFYILPDDIDEPTEGFAVTVSESTATPQGFTSATGNFRITDDPADLPPAASVQDESIGEWEQTVDVDVNFAFDENTKETTQTVTIPWHTVDGSAKQGEDYEYTKGVITLKPGDLTAKVNVPVINDKMKENDENFYVKLLSASPTGASIARGAGEVIIKSDDKADAVTPTLSVKGPAKGVGLATFSGTASPNSTVELWGAPLPTTDPKEFKYLSETDSDDDGYFELSSKSLSSGWAFVARSHEINSAVKTVKVTQNPSFSASSPSKGKLSVSVAGNPRTAGQAVTVQRWSGGKWSTVGKGTSTATGWKGTFSYKSKTKLTLRAMVAGNASAGINTGYSGNKTVTIK